MKLGDKVFKTKKEAKTFVSQYLKTHNKIDINDKIWILDLLQMHPRWLQKSADMKDITIKKTDRGQNAFHLIKNTGELEDISYLKCFNGENEHLLLYKALRYDIEKQIISFRNQIFESDVSCEICSEILQNNSTTHIDHIIPFSDIAKEFLSQFGHIETKSTGYNRTIVDETIRKKWFEYHLKHAKLRPLCSECNLTI